MTETRSTLPSEQLGPAERLLEIVLNSSAHLWHNRPGLDVRGVWQPARGNARTRGVSRVEPGLFVPAAEALYSRLLDVYRLNVDLMAHFASYALTETDWRDLKVACSALMLVQPRSGQPVHDHDGSVGFFDDDYRVIGEAMILRYQRKSPRMMTPKGVLRVAELLETPGIVTLNRAAGFADPASKKAPLGRWERAATKWLRAREKNPPLLEGLVKAGYKETIKALARKVGYKPESSDFFRVLGWKQKQAVGGHRTIGLSGLELKKRARFDELSEAEICEVIAHERLSYKDVVGRLPKEVGLTPAILVACLPSLSDRDLRIMTPTLEELGLMTDPEIRRRWEKALETATDQRSLNVARNVQNQELREKLETAAGHAIANAVLEASRDDDVQVLFLIDRSGSMQGAIQQSKEVLTRLLAGFPPERLHIASFDTIGTVHRPKAPTRAGVEHMLSSINASGGTIYASGVRALHQSGVRQGAAKLVVIAVGDEAGEDGTNFARSFTQCGYAVSAMALVVNVAVTRGTTVRVAAQTLDVPFTEVSPSQFEDPYQVPRVLRALIEAPRQPGAKQYGLVERVMNTPLLTLAS